MCAVFKHLTEETPANVEQPSREAQKPTTPKAPKSKEKEKEKEKVKEKEKEKEKDKHTSKAGSTSLCVCVCLSLCKIQNIKHILEDINHH